MNMRRVHRGELTSSIARTADQRDHLTRIAANNRTIIRQGVSTIITLADTARLFLPAPLAMIAVVIVVVIVSRRGGSVLVGLATRKRSRGMDGEDTNDTLVQVLAIIRAKDLFKQGNRIPSRDLESSDHSWEEDLVVQWE